MFGNFFNKKAVDYDDDYSVSDPELNLDALEPTPPGEVKNDRSPVTGIINFTENVYRDVYDDNEFIEKTLKSIVPKSFGDAYELGKNVFQTSEKIIEKSKDKIGSSAGLLSKSIASAIPDSSKRIKPFFNNIARKLGVEDKDPWNNSRQPEKNKADSAVEQALKELDLKQSLRDKTSEVAENSRNLINQNIQTERFEINKAQNLQIGSEIAKLNYYNEKVNLTFQRKSLEYQMRIYYVLSDILIESKNTNTQVKQNLLDIKTNTALPEVQKILLSERIREQAYDKFFGFFQSNTTDSFNKIFKNLEKVILNKTESIGEILKMSSEQIDSMVQMQESMSGGMGGDSSFDEIGMPQTGPTSILELLAQQQISELVKNNIYKQYQELAPRILNNERVKLLDERLKYGMANGVEELKNLIFNDENDLENFGEENRFSKIKDLLKGITTDLLEFDSVDTSIKKKDLSIDSPIDFDNRTYKSINFAIPGFLARILQELKVTRTGDESPLESFDYQNNKFINKKDIKKIIEKTVFNTNSLTNATNAKRKFYDTIKEFDVDQNLDEETVNNLVTFLQKRLISNKGIRFSNLSDSSIYQQDDKLSSKSESIAEIFKKAFNLNIDNKLDFKNIDDLRNANNLDSIIRNLGTSITDPRAVIQRLYDLGYKEELIEAGILDKFGNKIQLDDILEKTNKLDPNTVVEEEESTKRRGRSRLVRTSNTNRTTNKSIEYNNTTIDYTIFKEMRDNDKAHYENYTNREVIKINYLQKLDYLEKIYNTLLERNSVINNNSLGNFNYSDLLRRIRERFPDSGANINIDQIREVINEFISNNNPRGFSERLTLGEHILNAPKSIYYGVKNTYKKTKDLWENRTIFRGDGIKKLINKAKPLYNKTKENALIMAKNLNEKLIKERDIYLDDPENPVMLSYRMKAGKYRDSLSDLIIYSPSDILKVVGHIIDIDNPNAILVRKEDFPNLNVKDLENNNFITLAKELSVLGFNKTISTAKKIAKEFETGGLRAFNFSKKLRNQLTKIVVPPQDVFVRGEDKPRLIAFKMLNGKYFLKGSNKVVETPLDITDEVYELVDDIPKTILTYEDLSTGIVDYNGKPFEGLITKGLKSGIKAGSVALNLLLKTAKAGAKAFDNAFENMGKLFSKIPGFDLIAINGKKNLFVLEDIRDLINSRLPGEKQTYKRFTEEGDFKAEDFKSSSKNKDIKKSISETTKNIKDKVSAIKNAGSSSIDAVKKAFGFGKQKVKEASDNWSLVSKDEQGNKKSLKETALSIIENKLSSKINNEHEKWTLVPKENNNNKTIENKNEDLKLLPKDEYKRYPTSNQEDEIKIKGEHENWTTTGKEGISNEPKTKKENKLSSFLKSTKDNIKNKLNEKKELLKEKIKEKKEMLKLERESKKEEQKIERNDADGDGDRDGNARDIIAEREQKRLKAIEEREKELANRTNTTVTPDRKNTFDLIGDVISGAKDSLMNFLSTGKDLLMSRGMGKIAGGATTGTTAGNIANKVSFKDKMSNWTNQVREKLGKKIEKDVVNKTTEQLAKPATNAAVQSISDKATGGAASKLSGMGGMALKGLGIGGALYSGAEAVNDVAEGNYWSAAFNGTMAVLGGAMAFGKLGALAAGAGKLALTLGAVAGTVITAPATGIAAAIIGAGALSYWAYKRTRRSLNAKLASPIRMIRFAQYGLTRENTYEIEVIEELEQRLSKDIVFDKQTSEATIKDSDIPVKDLCDMFGIDEKDKKKIDSWSFWFLNRFKPVYLLHKSILNKIDEKEKLENIDNLELDAKEVYLKGIRFKDGPYNLTESPFMDIPKLQGTAELVEYFYNQTEKEINELKEKRNKKIQKAKEAGLSEEEIKKDIIDNKENNDLSGLDRVLNSPFMVSIKEGFKDFANKFVSAGKNIYDGIGKLTNKTIDVISGGIKAVQKYMGYNVSAFEAIRLKAYGLKDMDALKVRTLRYLEDWVSKDVKFYSDSTAKWSGDISEFIKKFKADFDIPLFNFKQHALLKEWFKQRFLPLYLYVIGQVKVRANVIDLESAELKLKAIDKFEISSNIRANDEIWGINISPWEGYVLNLDTKSTEENFNVIKKQVEEEKLAEEKAAEAKKNKESLEEENKKKEKDAGLNTDNKESEIKNKPLSEDQANFYRNYKRYGSDEEIEQMKQKEQLEKQKELDNVKNKFQDGYENMNNNSSIKTSLKENNYNDPNAPTVLENNQTRNEQQSVVNTTENNTKEVNQNKESKDYSNEGRKYLKQEPEVKHKNIVSDSSKIKNSENNSTEEMKRIIKESSELVGIDPNLALAIAAIESGYKPNAKAPTSSASGLFQFINSTWRGMKKAYGNKYGIDPNADVFDPKANAIMGAAYIKENIGAIKNNRPNPNATDIYMAHFLGGGGANAFFNKMNKDPNAYAAYDMTSAASANQSIFYKNSNLGQPRTYQEVYDLMSNKVNKRLNKIDKDIKTVEKREEVKKEIPKVNEDSYDKDLLVASRNKNNDQTTPTQQTNNSVNNDSNFIKTSYNSTKENKLEPVNNFRENLKTISESNVVAAPPVKQEPQQNNQITDYINKSNSILSESLSVQRQMSISLETIVKSINPETLRNLLKTIDKTKDNEIEKIQVNDKQPNKITPTMSELRNSKPAQESKDTININRTGYSRPYA